MRTTIKPLIYFLTLLMFTIMSETTQAQETPTPAEQAKAEAEIAKAKKDAAEAELAAAKAKKELAELNAPKEPTEKEVAETNKAIAEANKATAEAKKSEWAGPTVTPPTGDITADGTFIESNFMARKTLTGCFKKVVGQMEKNDLFKNKAVKLAVYNQADFTGIEFYATLLEQVKGMEKQLKATNSEAEKAIKADPDKADLAAPMLVGAAISGVLKSAADIVSLFRTTTDFKNFDITHDEMTTTSTLKSVIQESGDEAKKWKLYYPAAYPINTVKSPAGNSPFIDAMNKVNVEDVKAKTNIQSIEARITEVAESVNKEEEELKKAGAALRPGESPARTLHQKKLEAFAEKKKRSQSYIKKLETLAEHLRIMSDAFAKLQNLLATADATTKITGQAAIMRAERLVNFLTGDSVYVIKLTATSKGSNKITKNLWRSARIEHSAGTSLDVLIFDAYGEVVFSSNEKDYIPYTKPKDIKE